MKIEIDLTRLSELIEGFRQEMKNELASIRSEMNSKPEFYTINEVAVQLKVTRQTVYNWINEKKIKATYVGDLLRISEFDLRDFLSRNQKSG
ncbi:MAG: helix-turn-helix domain-containing protein [Bacteroidia bacterium]